MPSLLSFDANRMRSVAATHPDMLALMAHLHGHDAPDTNTASVLEIGCADGGNLVPLAALLPRATFVGMDASASSLDAAREYAARLRLTNARWMEADMPQPGSRKFDYILCHDFFSRTDAEARRSLLAACKALLSPNGVMYLHYGVHPGADAFHEFTDLLAWAGLQLMDDPAFSALAPGTLPSTAATAVQAMACHADIALNPVPEPRRLERLFFDCQAVAQPANRSPQAGTWWIAPAGQSLFVAGTTAIGQALHWLKAHFPARVSLTDILAQFPTMPAHESNQLKHDLLACARHGIVGLGWRPFHPPAMLSRPAAWPVARDQARHGTWASSLLHQVVNLDNLPVHAAALILLDGQRTLEDVQRVLVKRALDGKLEVLRHGIPLTDPDTLSAIFHEWVWEVVRDLGRFGFLAADARVAMTAIPNDTLAQ